MNIDKMYITRLSIIVLLFLLVFTRCSKKKSELTWEINFPVIGSQSSIRATDLNQDGIQDLVIGAGKNDFQYAKQGVLALNGADGELLWQHETHDQVFGSATFYDVNSDGIKDVFIGGRSANLKALNGKDGSLLWKYEYVYESDSILKHARFNFYNSVMVPDQNKDGFDDLLIVNGGNVKAPFNSEKDRFPGVLMLFDSKNGNILAADTMPDGKETYMSPIAFQQPGHDEVVIIFGSGGETFSGHLYRTTLTDFMTMGLSKAIILAGEEGHGFIAPPVAADINNDGFYDIVAISHASTTFAIDGISNKVVWSKKIGGTESSNSFAVGQFTDDDIPDFFTFISKGEWPDNRGSIQIVFNGKDGTVEFMDSIGCTGFSSPVVYDFNKDGTDDAIISINEYDCSRGFGERISETIQNKLISIDFKRRDVNIIDETHKFKNIFTTPWIGDLDDDGYIDIVYAQYFSESTYLTAFLGMRVRRISTSIHTRKPVTWGAYMGSNGDGVYSINAQ